MICVLVSTKYRMTVDRLLEALRGSLPCRIVPVTYEQAANGAAVEGDVVIFTDFERMTPNGEELAAAMWRDLARGGRKVRRLNHPLLVMRRYELLRTLHDGGINDFDVYRLTEARLPRRYPAFIRGENDNRGTSSGLLHSRPELDAAIARLVDDGRSRASRMIVEYRGAPDERGYFRRYGAYCVGGTIVPRDLAFGRNWTAKLTDVELDDDLLALEHAYLRCNPHREALRRIFEIARIDYGRVDYNVVDGRIQVYEINTKPAMYSPPTEARHRGFFPDLAPASERLAAALAALESGAPGP